MNYKIVQNIIVFVLLAQLANVDCDLKGMATRKKTKAEEIAQGMEGWGGPPESIQKGISPNQSNPKEYFYARVNAKASQKSIDKGQSIGIQTTCMDAAGLTGAYEILSSFMDAHIQEKKISDENGFITLQIDETKTYTCKYFQSEDKKLKTKECSGTLQNRGTAQCWSTSGDSWETCGCLVYIRFPGGKESVLKKLSFHD
jgi:hypothetical protein